MTKWWSADYHANHANCLRFENRGLLKPGDLDAAGNWVSTEVSHQRALDHNALLKRNTWARVKPGDTLTLVGDCACKGVERGTAGLHVTWSEFMAGLPGKIIVVCGNHDERNSVKTDCDYMEVRIGGMSAGVQHKPLFSLPEYEQSIREGATPLPLAEVELMSMHSRYCASRHAFMICGHVHQNWLAKFVAGIWHINVGISAWRMMPCNEQAILKLYYKLKKEDPNARKVWPVNPV